ncbi:hypothetical protein GW17_00037068 [Ensete ventricosum]|nr:hypothetical protein GW17_00037068 [Ensete ventricosum]
MKRELPTGQRKQRMSERVAVDDPRVSAVSQRSCPQTNDDRSYRLTANKKKERCRPGCHVPVLSDSRPADVADPTCWSRLDTNMEESAVVRPT